eukprot:gb/GFBE01027668.1/.p1 GENE.gb/GFBE01027668.1/~~gb/GFBE01027668.1/.p1  ORF type:complete len:484 (+),score=82.50 gb/GFBE01027668.1/:1-1452(+)
MFSQRLQFCLLAWCLAPGFGATAASTVRKEPRVNDGAQIARETSEIDLHVQHVLREPSLATSVGAVLVDAAADLVWDGQRSPPASTPVLLEEVCCQQKTAECFACSRGMSVEEYCKDNSGVAGCQEITADAAQSLFLTKDEANHTFEYVGCASSSQAWQTPTGMPDYGEVNLTSEGAEHCFQTCGKEGFKYGGLICPRNLRVSCKCANTAAIDRGLGADGCANVQGPCNGASMTADHLITTGGFGQLGVYLITPHQPRDWRSLGSDTACAADPSLDDSQSFLAMADVPDLAACTLTCETREDRCAGIEYNKEAKLCKIWIASIINSVQSEGTECHKYVPKQRCHAMVKNHYYWDEIIDWGDRLLAADPDMCKRLCEHEPTCLVWNWQQQTRSEGICRRFKKEPQTSYVVTVSDPLWSKGKWTSGVCPLPLPEQRTHSYMLFENSGSDSGSGSGSFMEVLLGKGSVGGLLEPGQSPSKKQLRKP